MTERTQVPRRPFYELVTKFICFEFLFLLSILMFVYSVKPIIFSILNVFLQSGLKSKLRHKTLKYKMVANMKIFIFIIDHDAHLHHHHHCEDDDDDWWNYGNDVFQLLVG